MDDMWTEILTTPSPPPLHSATVPGSPVKRAVDDGLGLYKKTPRSSPSIRKLKRKLNMDMLGRLDKKKPRKKLPLKYDELIKLGKPKVKKPEEVKKMEKEEVKKDDHKVIVCENKEGMPLISIYIEF